jgi:plastocyanin
MSGNLLARFGHTVAQRHLGLAVIGALALVPRAAAAVMLAVSAAPAVAHASQTVTISAGAESQGGDIQLNEFAPVEVTINVGDTVTWNLDSTEFHDILFTG